MLIHSRYQLMVSFSSVVDERECTLNVGNLIMHAFPPTIPDYCRIAHTQHIRSSLKTGVAYTLMQETVSGSSHTEHLLCHNFKQVSLRGGGLPFNFRRKLRENIRRHIRTRPQQAPKHVHAANTHARAHTHTPASAYARISAHTQTHYYIHAYTRTRLRTHTHTHTHMNTLSTHRQTANAYTHARTHAHTHTRTHTVLHCPVGGSILHHQQSLATRMTSCNGQFCVPR